MTVSVNGERRKVVRSVVFRGFVAVAVVAASFSVLWRELDDTRVSDILATLSTIPPHSWSLAVVASALSFLAVGQYDALFHDWLRTGVRRKRAMISGAASIAVAQCLGFGLLTGTLARWRTLPEASLPEALTVTNYVSLSFMAALGVLAAVATGISGLDMPGAGGFAAFAVLAGFTICGLSFVPVGHLPFAVPPLRLLGRLTCLAAVDTGLAALALWVLLPPETGIAAPHLFAAFLVALTAGFVSGTPGGIGPFETCLVLLLPGVPAPELLASVLAFRIVYFALPACIAIVVLARPGEGARNMSPPLERKPSWRAESGLAALPGHRIVTLCQSPALTARAGSSLVVIGDGLDGNPLQDGALAALASGARRQGLWPVLYKVGARTAVIARQRGWRVIAVSEEAIVIPVRFSTDGPRMRQLRRKLRQAETSGITITTPLHLPFEEMAGVADAWARRSGGERGFTMGRFERSYVDEQHVYLAWQEKRLVAFLTLHVAAGEWTLDLMRSADDAPGGVMHALLTRAVEDAAARGVARLSLAAMSQARPRGPLALLSRHSGAAGLRRFKVSFAPQITPLYLAAPTMPLLALSALSILISICFSSPIRDIARGRDLNAEPCNPLNAALQQ